MTRLRYKSINAFLRVSPMVAAGEDRLTKIRYITDYLKQKCQEVYQPHRDLSVDERMVASKARFSFRQYIRDKPTKWGFKLWVLAESSTGYTWDFDVYTGHSVNAVKSAYGVAYDVVYKLCNKLFGQFYRVFFDNFYTSVQLLKDLLIKHVLSCGTARVNRKGFPVDLTDVKTWSKRAARGDMRWTRDGNVVALQWKDNKPVTLMSTMHTVNGVGHVKRRHKNNEGRYERLNVKQPAVVKDYNDNMAGVDRSDQLIGKYSTLRKTNKWWKTLFYHYIDIARVNSYILFKEWQSKHIDVEELKRSARFGQLDFTEELIRQLGQIEDWMEPPTYGISRPNTPHTLIPQWCEVKRNCKMCYQRNKTEHKTYVRCETCGIFLCFNRARNCLLDYHNQCWGVLFVKHCFLFN